MTDPEHDAEAAVRRLLAQARHDEPIPPDVAARLDDSLAALSAERAADPGPQPPPTDLGGRRRRRAAVLLAAAAVLVVGGFTVGHLLGGQTSGTTASSSPDSSIGGSVGSPGAASRVQGGRGLPDNETDAAPSDTGYSPADLDALTRLGEIPTVSQDQVTRDVTALLTRLSADPGTGTSRRLSPAGARRLAERRDCRPARLGAGLALPVTYAGTPAVLVLRPRTGETRVADLLQCGTGTLLRSVTLTLP